MILQFAGPQALGTIIVAEARSWRRERQALELSSKSKQGAPAPASEDPLRGIGILGFSAPDPAKDRPADV